MAERSEANAKDATQSFSKEKLAPFASHTNPQSKPGVTFAAQDKLPKLPIPDLEQTCNKYMAALDPLQTAREHADTERAVLEFLRSDGPELQEKLKQYATGQGSYIEQFCRLGQAFLARLLLTSARVRLVSQLRQPCGPQPQPVLPARG